MKSLVFSRKEGSYELQAQLARIVVARNNNAGIFTTLHSLSWSIHVGDDPVFLRLFTPALLVVNLSFPSVWRFSEAGWDYVEASLRRLCHIAPYVQDLSLMAPTNGSIVEALLSFKHCGVVQVDHIPNGSILLSLLRKPGIRRAAITKLPDGPIPRISSQTLVSITLHGRIPSLASAITALDTPSLSQVVFIIHTSLPSPDRTNELAAALAVAAPRLRNLVLAKCRQLTDRAVLAITRLGKNLHYIHLGHCSRITDAGVCQLVKLTWYDW